MQKNIDQLNDESVTIVLSRCSQLTRMSSAASPAHFGSLSRATRGGRASAAPALLRSRSRRGAVVERRSSSGPACGPAISEIESLLWVLGAASSRRVKRECGDLLAHSERHAAAAPATVGRCGSSIHATVHVGREGGRSRPASPETGLRPIGRVETRAIGANATRVPLIATRDRAARRQPASRAVKAPPAVSTFALLR
jgi:hypothetical protein